VKRDWQQPLPSGQVLPATVSGVDLGVTKSGRLTVRLFRPRGTRIAVFSAPYVAQLITLRAALAGASVRVATRRQTSWAGVVRHGGDSHFIAHTGHGQPAAHRPPTLVVDDLADVPGPVGDATDWQCLLQVARLDQAGRDLTRLSGLSHADLAFFDALSEPLAAEVGHIFGLGTVAASLTVVPRHAVAVVSRGQVQLVRPELSAGERATLGT
jgi:hypothetical protein